MVGARPLGDRAADRLVVGEAALEHGKHRASSGFGTPVRGLAAPLGSAQDRWWLALTGAITGAFSGRGKRVSLRSITSFGTYDQLGIADAGVPSAANRDCSLKTTDYLTGGNFTADVYPAGLLGPSPQASL